MSGAPLQYGAVIGSGDSSHRARVVDDAILLPPIVLRSNAHCCSIPNAKAPVAAGGGLGVGACGSGRFGDARR
jgi:hypothetical protein